MTIEERIVALSKAARQAATEIGRCSPGRKNAVLLTLADLLNAHSGPIMAANRKDLEAAEKKGLSAAFIDRLTIKPETINAMAEGLREVVQLADPVGAVKEAWVRPNGLEISRLRIPLGVIGIIYESRPNVTIDAAGLCLKAGNAVILRGGSEAFHSNECLAALTADALRQHQLPASAVQAIPMRDREAVTALLQQDECIDLIIPRGGESLIRYVVENSKIPVLKHYKGVCHIYVDAGADLNMAADICFNAKVQRPGVCNAMETMLVNQQVADDFLPVMAERFQKAGVELRGCPATCDVLPGTRAATDDDWPTEYEDLILAVRVVDDLDQAMAHISRYGSNHTEAIVTRDHERARRFVREVDSSLVLVNASTRFNDGNQLGLGAEIGISTSKLHAFGPMGLEELTTTKFVAFGSGHIREN